MDNLFKSGNIAKKLSVTNNTIRRWVHRYPEYFSEDAISGSRHYSTYTEDDFRILVSIHQLSAAGHSLEAIEQKLAEGYRYEGSLTDFEPLIFPSPSSGESKSIKTLEMMLAQAQERINDLIEKLGETQYKLGVAEGKLEACKESQQK